MLVVDDRFCFAFLTNEGITETSESNVFTFGKAVSPDNDNDGRSKAHVLPSVEYYVMQRLAKRMHAIASSIAGEGLERARVWSSD